MNLSNYRKDIINGKKRVEDITDKERISIVELSEKYKHKEFLTNEELDEVKDLIYILCDFYTYHPNGEILISDHDYDLLMNNYIMNGGKQISTSDIIKGESLTQWEFVKHENPGMVGTIKKIYDEIELYRYFTSCAKDRDNNRYFQIAPKFDGISSAICIDSNGNLLNAVTRNDGYMGQDIRQVVERCKNFHKIKNKFLDKMKGEKKLWIKTELVMKTDDFEELIKEKSYVNRRSATSGIVNSPKNLEYAKYVTIIPLAWYYENKNELIYSPKDSEEVITDHAQDLLDRVYKMLSKVRDASYPIRTDGVVIFPLTNDKNIFINKHDFMEEAIAYKVNTNEAYTTVDYGYVSIGKLGNARPMLHVHPVEVNETIVKDVSLGSFDIFASMDLHEGEQVLIYSAGDVIPQAKLPEDRSYNMKAKLIKIKKKCPYCNEKLKRFKGTYRCVNQNCIRVITGRITNFISKLKVKNISDKTIEDLYDAGLIKRVPDIFDLTIDDIKDLKGYGIDSANIIIEEFQKLKESPITISELLGSLGIQGISMKKCKCIIDAIGSDYKRMLKKNPNKLYWDLVSGDGIGEITASVFIDFLSENQSLILELLDIMNIHIDKEYKANIVFTGFRDDDLEKKFNKMGFEISNNVNSKTYAVIDSSYAHTSTKCKSAKSKNIPIYHTSELEDLYLDIKEDF